MELFHRFKHDPYEQIIFCHEKESGLKAIIAIHDTTLGPALGGTRMWNYDTEEEAIEDVLRLAKGMTYKAAVAGLNLGGGKAVILGDPQKDKSEALFRAFGRYIQGLQGRFITAEDVGTNEEDMDMIYLETRYVTGLSSAYGSRGNPSPLTALGVYRGMQATCQVAFGEDRLYGKTVAVQGAGSVAYELCRYLHEEGAKIIVTDIDQEKSMRIVNDFSAQVVSPNQIYDVECDIFSPCALGGIIHEETLDRLRCRVIAGSANNQLREDHYGKRLEERGIFYAPDYVINAGGLMNVADELMNYNYERVLKKVNGIYDNILKVFHIAKRDQIPSFLAADRLAEERIQTLSRSRKMYLQNERSILDGYHRA